MERVKYWLLLSCLLSIPFGNWKIITLPINGKVFGIDPSGLSSVSFFHFFLFSFFVFMFPECIAFVRRGEWKSRFSLHWFIGIALMIVLFAYLKPVWPYLSASQSNYIDARTYLILFCGMVVLTVYFALRPMNVFLHFVKIFNYWLFFVIIISTVLFLMSPAYFYEHYPFTTTLAFPFRSSNNFAMAVLICLAGMYFHMLNKGQIWTFAFVISLLSTILLITGSRSGTLLGVFVVVGLISATLFYYYANDKRNDVMRFAKSVVLTIAMAGIFLLPAWHLVSVQRSISLLAPFLYSPLTVLAGDSEDGARKGLWGKALAGSSVGSGSKKYRLNFYVVQDGCKKKLDEHLLLNVGDPYTLTMSIDHVYQQAKVVVASGSESSSYLVENIPFRVNAFFPFVADSAGEQKYMRGSVRINSLEIDGGERDALRSEVPILFEHGYEEDVTETRSMSSQPGKLLFHAQGGAVAAFSKIPLPSSHDAYAVAFTLQVDELDHNFPIDSRSMFYAGFSDMDEKFRVGSAFYIEVKREDGEKFSFENRRQQMREIATFFPDMTLSGGLNTEVVAKLNAKASCSDSKALKLAFLRVDPIASHELDRVLEQTGGHSLALVAAEDDQSESPGFRAQDGTEAQAQDGTGWDADYHLYHRGSTHNVYIDFYYYVGIVPFIMFALFVITFISLLISKCWMLRRSPHFVMAISIAMQAAIVFAFIYGHPLLWMPLVWGVFALASSLFLLGDRERDMTELV